MKVELARESDLEQIHSMICEISNWLKMKGIYQWSDSFPIDILKGEFSRDELFVCRSEDEVYASVALSKNAGDLWGECSGEAIYLHRLMIARSKAGSELGKAIMSWAESFVREQKVSVLRLVCDAENSFLKSYYQGFGFSEKGTKYYAPYEMEFARFEKVLS